MVNTQDEGKRGIHQGQDYLRKNVANHINAQG